MAAEKVRAGENVCIEVFDALPDRPITGERTVSADGTIDLGYYGRVKVAGLTINEAKERIVLHLREYLYDEQLGLVELSGDGPSAIGRRIEPANSDGVLLYIEARFGG
jgi:hypothetical protein